jgi:hypothetical protein
VREGRIEGPKGRIEEEGDTENESTCTGMEDVACGHQGGYCRDCAR